MDDFLPVDVAFLEPLNGQNSHDFSLFSSLEQRIPQVDDESEDDGVDGRPSFLYEGVDHEMHLLQGDEGAEEREQPADDKEF